MQSDEPLGWLGRRSYGIYLLHMALLHLWLGNFGNTAFARTHGYLASRLFIWAAVASTFLLAELSYRLLESPILRFGHRFRYRS